ncbi:glycosyltransferase family 2 protein [Candidatus Methylomirabilis sp.]|uniref:glycosyltransferase family 2 protein n=1 Tax=Candidatus Methylomirabilis sp. TaxID=2032687 RepID=UPI002A64528A|nr:glycosyltransferase family 2 protein [Candidatus Methylomirabilis sp.]
MIDPRVAVGIINYGDYRHLPVCLDSVKRQSLRADRIILLDNQSRANEIGPIGSAYPEVQILAMQDNLGYSGGANRIVREADGYDHVMLLNPDVVLGPRHLEELVGVMVSAPGVGSVGGKLLLGDSQAVGGPCGDAPRILDSTGHLIFRSRRVIDRGHGECDVGQYDRPEEVFSICGAAVLYRRSMLDDIQIDGEYFDEDFFAYKEDVDTCWRAQLLGWSSRYHPAAIAYHLRGWKRRDDRRRVPWLRKYHSFKNHSLMMIKNELPALLRRDCLPILWLGIRAMAYVFLVEPALLKAVLDLKKYVPGARYKRGIIMGRCRSSAERMGRWFI